VSRVVIKGGEVVTAGSRFAADLIIADGRIVQIGGDTPCADGDVVVLDAAGCQVLPGGVDMHVHLTPAFTPAGVGPGGVATDAGGDTVETAHYWSDDFASGSRAAAAGGITTIGNMTFPHVGEPLAAAIERTAAEVSGLSLIDFTLHPITLTAAGVTGQLAGLAAAGCGTIKIFTMLPSFDQEAAEYVSLIAAAGRHGLLTMIHCEDAGIVAHATHELMAHGRGHPSNYGLARPVIAEAVAVARAAAIAEATGSPVYIVHVSSQSALRVAAEAKARGVPLYVETRPIYLLFDDTRLTGENGPLYIGNPPLRTASDVAALWRGLANGEVDTCCTDHAPASRADKLGESRDLTNVAPGLADLETMLPILYSQGVAAKRISLERFVELSSTNAAKIFGLYPRKGTIAVGSDADLVLWNPAAEWTFRWQAGQSRSDFSLYDGWRLTGRIVATISRGDVIYQDGAITAPGGRGRYLRAGGIGG
jgi:dihydropyrimidinase